MGDRVATLCEPRLAGREGRDSVTLVELIITGTPTD